MKNSLTIHESLRKSLDQIAQFWNQIAIALELAIQRLDAAGLVLQNTFTSMKAMAKRIN